MIMHCLKFSFITTLVLACLTNLSAQDQSSQPYTTPDSSGARVVEPVVLGVFDESPTGSPASANEPQMLEMSLEEAIEMALMNNLDLQIQKFNPLIEGFRLEDALAGWIPSLRGQLTKRDDSNPGGINPQTNEPFPSNQTQSTFIRPSLQGLLPMGTAYTISFDTIERSGAFIPAERRFTGSWTAQVTQPLLRGLLIDETRRFMRVSRKNVELSYAQLEQTMMQILRDVEVAYFDLIASRENVKVQEMALELGLQTLRENRKRVEVGVMAPLDETEAEAQVATSRASLIQARQELRSRQNNIKRLISDDFASIYETDVVPSDDLVPPEFDFDVYASWSHGLVKRPELVQARLQLERQDVIIKFQRNQRFPQVDLIASYGANGVDSSYGNLWTDFSRRNDPSTSFGLQFQFPIYNQAARSRHRAAKAEKEMMIVQLKNLEQQIQAEIAQNVDLARSAREQLAAQAEARRFAEKALEVEQVKLANGKSTSFVVLRLQRDLTQRRADEIAAMVNYRRALTSLSFSEGTIIERNGILIDSTQRDPD